MNFSALARIPFQAVLAVCDALVESDAKRQARMLSRMYPDMDALNEIEGEIESHEPAAPYLSWGAKEPDYSIEVKDGSPYRIGEDFHLGPRYTYCNGCGSGYTGDHNCLRDLSPTPEGGNPGEVRAVPPAPSPGVDPSGANGSIPPGAVPGEGPVADSDIPPSPATGRPMTEVAFASRLGFGDNISEPAATLADMVKPIEQAFYDARDHQECPRTCERCGERLAATVCPDCNGSGCGPGTASGAYDECELCAGSGWLHDGCADKSYADLVTELQHVREGAQTLGRIIHRMQRVVLDITGLHSLIDETGDGPWDVVWEALAEGYGGSTARLSASYTPPK